MITSWNHAQADTAVAGLRARLMATVTPMIPRGAPVAFLDFPSYPNVGDSAIWMGGLAIIEEAGAAVRYAASMSSLSVDRLRCSLGERGVVVITGGGNFGDLWPPHHEHRLKVVRVLRDYPVIQLPQSIWIGDEAVARQTRDVIRAHPNFTLMVRDQRSLERAAAIGIDAVLCPDTVFALGNLPSSAPRRGLVWQSRHDHEGPAAIGPLLAPEVRPEDWLKETETPLRTLIRGVRRIGRSNDAVLTWAYRALARMRLERGCRFISRGRVLVTNRLHGQLMAILMGVPHVISDTRFGKVGDFYRTWLEPYFPGIYCATEQEALERGRTLAHALSNEQARPRR